METSQPVEVSAENPVPVETSVSVEEPRFRAVPGTWLFGMVSHESLTADEWMVDQDIEAHELERYVEAGLMEEAI